VGSDVGTGTRRNDGASWRHQSRRARQNALIDEAIAFVRKVASGPTRAHAAHKALLRIWAIGGLAAADEAIWDIALPLFESEDTKLAIPAAVQVLAEGKPRPQFRFKGR